MKKAASLFAQPRFAISIAAIVALIIGVSAWNHIGQAPDVASLVGETSTSSAASTGQSVSLAFNVSGRIVSVSVKVGDKVKKGAMLAALDGSVAMGAVNQAKGALDLAKAQYGSLSIQYDNAKKQQDLLVENAYRTLLSSGLAAFPTGVNDETHNPVISGTYTCDKEGSYEIDPYASETVSGYSFTLKGLEEGSGEVTYGTPQPLGTCGLLVTFVEGFYPTSKWTVSIPNKKSATYQANKNAYDLAVATRTQTLTQLSANLGNSSTTDANIAGASIAAAEGAYETALAEYQNTLIVSPVDGVVSFVDSGLKVGQSAAAGRPMISIAAY